jgi:dTMP kinase
MEDAGKLIVIEGTDGSGKATQSQRLLSRLEKEGFLTAYSDFPRYGEKSAGMV